MWDFDTETGRRGFGYTYGDQRTVPVIGVVIFLLLLLTLWKCGFFPILPQIASGLQMWVVCSANGDVEDWKSLSSNV